MPISERGAPRRYAMKRNSYIMVICIGVLFGCGRKDEGPFETTQLAADFVRNTNGDQEVENKNAPSLEALIKNNPISVARNTAEQILHAASTKTKGSAG